MVWDGADGYVLYFGGCASASTCNGVQLGDTWIFAQNHWANLTPSLSNAPNGRAIPQIAYDAADQKVVMFGGLIGYSNGSSTALNDTWTFSHGVWMNITLNMTRAPQPRYRAAMTYDVADGYVLLFGGTFSAATINPYRDTWTYVHEKWTNITSNVTGSPPGRFRTSVAYDAADKEVVLFGGCVVQATPPAVCATSLTWVYSAGAWKNLTSTLTKAPSARVYATMAYDERDGYVLLFGGSRTTTTAPVFGDTWKFVANNWTNLTTGLSPAPSKRAQGMMAFDGATNLSVYFGGYNNAGTFAFGDTWAYGPPIVGYAYITPGRLDLGQSTTINVTATSNDRPLAYSYANPPSGCASANVTILVCTPTSSGSWAVNATVNDTKGDQVRFPLSLVVASDPSILQFKVSPLNVTVGTPVHFLINATGGSAPYRYSYHFLPSGCTTLNVANLTCTPRAAGYQTVEGQVVDVPGFSVTANVSFQVNPLPKIGAFNVSSPATDVGVTVFFRTNASGGTAPLHFLYTGLPAGCTSVDLANVTCDPASPSLSTVQVNVSDSFGWYTTATTTVTVSPAIRIDSSALSLASVDAGTPFTIWVNASGGTPSLGYSYSGLPAGCSFNGTATSTCRPPTPGNYSIVATVFDPVGGLARVTLNLTVVPDPAILSFVAGPATTDVGIASTLALTVANGTPSYSFAYLGLPAGCVTADSSVLTCTPTGPGHFAVSVVATDVFGKSASAIVHLAVDPDVKVVSFNSSSLSVTVGQAATFTAVATGGTGALTYAYAGLPKGCSSANTSVLDCTAQSAGNFNVVMTVRDGLGSSAVLNTSFAVVSPPSASPGLLGGSSGSGVLLVGLLAAVVVAGILAFVMVRRRRTAKPPTPPEIAPEPVAPEPWEES
ncbi:MAG: hypothetical protein L3K19_09000 [Thermoplasmata archaeon]|nr:hypothetical protein [Thermoplasmata archaeon]